MLLDGDHIAVGVEVNEEEPWGILLWGETACFRELVDEWMLKSCEVFFATEIGAVMLLSGRANCFC